MLLDLSAVVFLGAFLSVRFLYVSPSLVVSLVIVSLFVLLASFPIQVLDFCLDFLWYAYFNTDN